MNELYWITTLGNLKVFFVIATIVLFIIVSCLIVAVNTTEPNDDDEDVVKKVASLLKVCKICALSFAISIVGCILIPDEEQLYVIYGVGTTIDYLKENPNAKKLPDNVINALNAYLEDMLQKDENN